MTHCIRCNRHVVNAVIAVVENKMIKRGLVAICRHDVWDQAQEGLLSRRGNGTSIIVVALPSDHVIYISDCRFDLGCEKGNVEFACGGNRKGERFGLLFKETFAKPNSGEVERQIETEQ